MLATQEVMTKTESIYLVIGIIVGVIVLFFAGCLAIYGIFTTLQKYHSSDVGFAYFIWFVVCAFIIVIVPLATYDSIASQREQICIDQWVAENNPTIEDLNSEDYVLAMKEICN